MLRAEGMQIRDDEGRQVVFHGINLVSKGRTGAEAGDPSFRGSWTADDLHFLTDELGMNLVRLGVIWAAGAPVPHTWDEDYLAWVGEQLDLCHSVGLSVVLDGHQDLYSQQFSDGAPAWATLTEHTFEPEGLWSDGYLNSPAVQQSLDAFWANTRLPDPADTMGLQDHLIEFWVEVASRFGDHPAVVGIDVLNEPTPGTMAGEFAGLMLGTFAHLTGQDLEKVLADYDDPMAKLAQLGRLEDVAVHRELGDRLAPVMAEFEAVVSQFYDRAWTALRGAGFSGLLLREHCYFANTGVPALVEVSGDQVVYSPHGYDLVVDTEATPLASNVRAETIFTRVHENQQRWQVPVIVGEWGALGLMQGVTAHGSHLLDLFDRYGWSHTYWCWEDEFAASEAAALLRRSGPRAVDGTLESFGRTDEGFAASWRGAGSSESVFWIVDPDATVTVTAEGSEVGVHREGHVVTVAPALGQVDMVVRSTAAPGSDG